MPGRANLPSLQHLHPPCLDRTRGHPSPPLLSSPTYSLSLGARRREEALLPPRRLPLACRKCLPYTVARGSSPDARHRQAAAQPSTLILPRQTKDLPPTDQSAEQGNGSCLRCRRRGKWSHHHRRRRTAPAPAASSRLQRFGRLSAVYVFARKMMMSARSENRLRAPTSATAENRQRSKPHGNEQQRMVLKFQYGTEAWWTAPAQHVAVK